MTVFSGSFDSRVLVAPPPGLAGAAFDAQDAPGPTPATAAYVATSSSSGAVTRSVPTIPSRSLGAGSKALSFAADWYNRVHITPSVFGIGNLVSSLTVTYKIWNGHLDATRVLSSAASSNDTGIAITPPSALPITFQPNQELTWSAAISVQGPPTIAASYTYSFTGGESVSLAFTGQRITAWALSPDWAAPVAERLEFKTDVMRAWSGAEQRRALRIAPRRVFTFNAQLSRQERRFVEAQLFDWSARIWALPIWPDGQLLAAAVSAGATSIACDTVSRDFTAGGMAILIASAVSYEVVPVLSVAANALTLSNPVQSNWPAQTRLYPARAALLLSYPKLSRANGNFSTASPSFLVTEPCDWSAASGLATYRSAPVLENAPDEGSMEMTLARDTVMIDNDTGVVAIDDHAGIGLPTSTHNWFIQGRANRAAFRALLYLLKGRQGEIWIPTYQQDLKISAAVAAGQAYIDVELTGYALYLLGQMNRQDIRIELYSGTILYRRIIDAAGLDAYTERLTLGSGIGPAVAMADVRRISYMALCRLNSDAIEIAHHTADDGMATASTPWQSLNHGN